MLQDTPLRITELSLTTGEDVVDEAAYPLHFKLEVEGGCTVQWVGSDGFPREGVMVADGRREVRLSVWHPGMLLNNTLFVSHPLVWVRESQSVPHGGWTATLNWDGDERDRRWPDLVEALLQRLRRKNKHAFLVYVVQSSRKAAMRSAEESRRRLEQLEASTEQHFVAMQRAEVKLKSLKVRCEAVERAAERVQDLKQALTEYDEERFWLKQQLSNVQEQRDEALAELQRRDKEAQEEEEQRSASPPSMPGSSSSAVRRAKQLRKRK